MFQAKVPKDIRVYKTKIVGNLTFRQFLSVAITLFIDFLVYQNILKPSEMPFDDYVTIFVLISIPILSFGWVRPMDMPLEKYLKYISYSLLFAPKKRKAKTIIYKEKKPEIKKPNKKRKKALDKIKSYQ